MPEISLEIYIVATLCIGEECFGHFWTEDCSAGSCLSVDEV